MEKHVKRKLLIARLLQRVFSVRPGSRSEIVWGEEIAEFDPLLKKLGPFFIALERVADELTHDLKVDSSRYEGREDDILSFEMSDPKKLERYIAEKEVELAEVQAEIQRHAFTLDEDAKLYLVNSELPPYSIERGSLRHKIVYYLAKHGGYISAAKLAEKVGTNPKRIRTTVGQIRDKVSKHFHVPGTDLINSRDTGSYSAGKVTLRVPKGYTP